MLVLYCYCLGNKSCAKRLAEYPAHVNFNGIADILLLFGLCPYKDIIVRETHDAFQLIYIQHAHLDVYDSVHGHELLYLASHFTVRFKNPYTDTFFCGDKVRGHLIHPSNQSEARLIDISTCRVELWVHQEAVNYFLLRCCQYCRARCVNAGKLTTSGVFICQKTS